ncbi:MAG: hypothetical protein AAF624_10635, partial [Bacteroidota bacterium]
DALERIDTPGGQEYFEDNILGALTDRDRFTYYYRRYQEGIRDPELIAPLFDLAYTLSEDEVVAELKPILLAMDPSLEVIRSLILVSGDDNEKLALLDRALEQVEVAVDRVLLLYEKARLLYTTDQLSDARNVANEVLEIDENHGRSLVLIGDTWAALASTGSIQARAPAWVAVDYYNRAASLDEGVAVLAQQRASDYRRYFPCREEVFFDPNVSEGGGYTVRGVRTTVRVRGC